ncbi:Fungal-trans domain-containing protein [Mycena venus]|uniref:Fungal-trans domain-containing protein n=1 Tax=Mycena venus TaxID=2733690 RepID=A0A8H6YKK4_9AGAR|nr:Fungal-trans domain-containing protein [Mycena venus]
MGRPRDRLAAGLLDALHLWAIHLSGSNEVRASEANYLSRALRATGDGLSGTHHRNTILHNIQAEVLLSHYFLRNNRFLEANYHTSAAVSLVLSSGVHRIRSGDLHASGGPLVPAVRRLPPAQDAIEENERINAFWTVLTLNNCWTTADGSPSNICYTTPDARIDTPWPLDINSPDALSLPDPSIGTVTNFLAGLPDVGVSMAALHAKAAILFEQASRLASQYHQSLINGELNQFFRSFSAVDSLIARFKESLPAVQLHPTRKILLIHCLAHVSTIQLHNPFVIENAASRMHVLESARRIVVELSHAPVNEFIYVDPIMGTLLMATCQAFIAELGRLKRHRGSGHQEKRSLVEAIQTVLAIMGIFSPSCPLMNSQLTIMQELYRNLN